MTIRATFDGSAIRPDEPDKLRQYKRSLTEGAQLAMTIEPWSERRNRGQQGLLHALMTRYAIEMGEKMPEVKMRTKLDLGHWIPAEKILDGTYSMPNYRGQFVDLHKVYPDLHEPMTLAFVRSESDYTVKMETEFIERIIEMCEANGVRTDDVRAEFEL